MEICSCNFTIEFNDIDENKLITERGFLRFLQEAGCIASSKLGYGINDESKTHIAWLLLNWKLRIFKRPSWNSNIKIDTWARQEDKLYSYRDFEVYDNENNLIAIASSKWVIADTKTHSLLRITDKMVKEYNYIDKSLFEELIINKIKEPKDYDSKINYTISRRDIDSNNHVNNLCYLDFAYQSLPEEIYQEYYSKFSNIEIMYKKEAILGDKISCFYKKIDENEYVVTIKSEDLKTLHAIIKLKI